MHFKNLLTAVALTFLSSSGAWAQAKIDVKNEQNIQNMTKQSFANFKKNKWAQFANKNNIWGWKTKDGDGYRYYWEQALCMMATCDLAEYGPNGGNDYNARQMVKQNLDGFLSNYGKGVGVGWNDYIDDLGWVQDAFALGYRIYKDPAYLNAAIRLFNTGFTRGNLGPYKTDANKKKDGSEGLWWRVDHSRWQPTNDLATQGTEKDGLVIKNNDYYKGPLCTNPHITDGAYLYAFTGDKTYLDKAEKLWQWEVNTLWEYSDDSGLHEGYNPPRPSVTDKDGNKTQEIKEGFRPRRTMHDLSSFFEGTNALWKVTGKEVYWAWCWKIINSVLTHRLDKNGIIQNKFNARDGSWCWEAGRAWTMFVADNKQWDFKGQVPDIEGTYTDYTGKKKTYTSKVQGQLASIPNGWTLYQFMAASASQIKDENGTCIILPTNRNADTWKGLYTANSTSDVDVDQQFYLYNVGTKQWIKTGGKSKNPDSPSLAAQADRTANVIVEQEDGTYKICDPEYAPQGWGVQGRNTIYESNNGSQNTRSWGTTLTPGFKFISTGDADGSVYIEYTWDKWTKGNNNIADPSGKTYGLYYGNWTLGTNGWTGNTTNDVADKGVYSDLADNLSKHGANAKWIIYPVGKGTVKVLPNPDNQFYLYNVGAKQWVKTGGKSKNPDSPTLAAQANRTANLIVKQADGSYTIADPDYTAGWGIQGRNTIYESNNGSQNTRSWGTSLTPGFKFVSTGRPDGSVYIEYTWGDWTKGNNDIDSPSGKTYDLFYGDWALGTNGWAAGTAADVAAKAVYPDLKDNRDAHGDYARWIVVPVGKGKINVLPYNGPKAYLYNVGQKAYIATGGKAKTPDTPTLVDKQEAVAQMLTTNADGTISIADPEYYPQAWGIQGRNTIYESNNGSEKTNSWGTTLIPGWKVVPTGDADGSVYLEYTWGTWTAGRLNIDNPSNKTYVLTYGDYDQNTNAWSNAQKADIAQSLVFGGSIDKRASYGANAKWILATSLDYTTAPRRVSAPTAIETITPAKKQIADKAVYNILGQKVADDASQLRSLPRGLYIVGGKKITIK